MKWLAKYKDGDVRIIKKFLVFPWKLDDEWRWLEYAYIKECYYMSMWLEKRWSTYGEYLHYKLEKALVNFNLTPEMISSDFKSGLTKAEQKELHDYMEDNPR